MKSDITEGLFVGGVREGNAKEKGLVKEKGLAKARYLTDKADFAERGLADEAGFVDKREPGWRQHSYTTFRKRVHGA